MSTPDFDMSAIGSVPALKARGNGINEVKVKRWLYAVVS